eukprot:Nitzschia sp. Nitz4//scaffold169_size48518//21727//23238//NITZ4_007071-RA/size48518-processed-gene-0.78-mRNA-1//1//CDS//3329538385//5549//frame0
MSSEDPESAGDNNQDAETKDDDGELLMKDISEPKETDVLCGRGGAALRHPGNQTYRRLVNLNKSMYITCQKTDKLKISRSIVAAIRDQNGRFLERDSKKQTYYDIGDKKAIEKTSQALREGQPKLRQKMIDSGQIPPNQGTNMEHQFGNGVYNTGPPRPTNSIASASSSGVGNSSFYSTDISQFGSIGPNGLEPTNSMISNNMDMPPPPSRTMSNDMSTDAIMQRLSLTSIGGPNTIPSWTPSLSSMASMDNGSVRSRLHPSLQPGGSGVAGELGFRPDATGSVLSNFSAYGVDNNGGGGGFNGMNQEAGGGSNNPNMNMQNMQQLNNNMGSMESNYFNTFSSGQGAPPPPPPPPAMSPMMESPSMRSNYDRRRQFARMKFSRQPSGRTENSMGDGMPDIHMVDSQFSLLSNLSGHGSRHDSNFLSNTSGHGDFDGGLGSRRSLMSGLSRISDHSGNSVFSDLSKKVGSTNMSTRSIAMSEVSEMGEEFEEVEFNFDSIAKKK